MNLIKLNLVIMFIFSIAQAEEVKFLRFEELLYNNPMIEKEQLRLAQSENEQSNALFLKHKKNLETLGKVNRIGSPKSALYKLKERVVKNSWKTVTAKIENSLILCEGSFDGKTCLNQLAEIKEFVLSMHLDEVKVDRFLEGYENFLDAVEKYKEVNGKFSVAFNKTVESLNLKVKNSVAVIESNIHEEKPTREMILPNTDLKNAKVEEQKFSQFQLIASAVLSLVIAGILLAIYFRNKHPKLWSGKVKTQNENEKTAYKSVSNEIKTILSLLQTDFKGLKISSQSMENTFAVSIEFDSNVSFLKLLCQSKYGLLRKSFAYLESVSKEQEAELIFTDEYCLEGKISQNKIMVVFDLTKAYGSGQITASSV